MGLFGKKPKIPGIDTNALNALVDEAANKKRMVVNTLGTDLAPISANFEAKRGNLGSQYLKDVDAGISDFNTGIGALKESSGVAGEEAARAFREQQFRDVPELQKAIRESLGGSGTLNTGAARFALANPTIQAAQASSDFAAQQKINDLQRKQQLGEKALDYSTTAKQGGIDTKFGLDKDTVDYLTSIGRSDLIDRANAHLGIEGEVGDARLSIEQARQQNDIARATAAANNRNAVLSGLTTLGGAGIGGLFGGPTGAALGGQFGSNIGQIATGQPVQFDPTLLYAMRNKTAVSRSLGGGRSTPTMPRYSTMVG